MIANQVFSEHVLFREGKQTTAFALVGEECADQTGLQEKRRRTVSLRTKSNGGSLVSPLPIGLPSLSRLSGYRLVLKSNPILNEPTTFLSGQQG